MKSIIAIGSLLICAALLTACGGLAGEPEVVGQMPPQPTQVTSVLPPDVQPDLVRGAEIFAENCVRCHGITGAGDGEFVQSGQITVIPDFTDPAQHEGHTPQEYYTTVTNGNLAKLMPPFSGSLSDEDRWSVANYVFTLAGDGALPQATADIPTEAETTDDASVIQINMVLTQIDVVDENTLQIWQLISLTNTSDKLYVYTDSRGESVSVRVPVPSGLHLSPDNDISRFVFNDNAVFDTQPIVPGEEHIFHLIYNAPFDGSLDFAQTLPYNFAGPYEVYVDSSALKVQANGWRVVDNPQRVNNIIYRGMAMVDGFSADEPINFSVQRSGMVINRQLLGYGIITIGLIFIALAAFIYRHAPKTVSTTESDNPIQALMKEIAALDIQFQNGTINQSDYEKQRKSLKDEVTKLMK